MLLLVVGLLLFLGVHSIRIMADEWRTQVIARGGEKRYKGIYALMSVVGLVLIVVGYGLARNAPVLLWSPPNWTIHTNWLITFVAFIIFSLANRPGGPLKVALRHPMVIAVSLWAFGHLLANGTLADLLLFGGFLGWSLLAWRAALSRDRAAGTVPVPGPWSRDIGPAIAGVALWLLFFYFAHEWLFGVSPRG